MAKLNEDWPKEAEAEENVGKAEVAKLVKELNLS